MRQDKFVVFSAGPSCIIKLEIPECDEWNLGGSEATKHSRGKGLVAGLEASQNNERRMFLALTSLASRETWYAAGAVRLGKLQVKLRGNRRGEALPG